MERLSPQLPVDSVLHSVQPVSGVPRWLLYGRGDRTLNPRLRGLLPLSLHTPGSFTHPHAFLLQASCCRQPPRLSTPTIVAILILSQPLPYVPSSPPGNDLLSLLLAESQDMSSAVTLR